jgi:membrane protease YdiL (CAAX protease family)
MEITSSLSLFPAKKSLKQLSWSILIILLFLRVILLGWFPVVAQGQFPWIEPVYQIGTYALTAFFLFLNRDHLPSFNIDRLAILIMVLFKPLQTIIMPYMGQGFSSNYMAFPNLPAILIWFIAAILLIALLPSFKTMPKIQKSNCGWLFIGAFAGILLVFIITFLLLPWTTIRKVTPIYDLTLLLAYPYQIGYAGVDEEPLFRGLLWGQLRISGWRNLYILFGQALVFMLAHGRLLTNISNLPFALSIFLGGVIFGLLVMRSRSVATSIVAHGFYNASGIFTYYLISRLFG